MLLWYSFILKQLVNIACLSHVWCHWFEIVSNGMQLCAFITSMLDRSSGIAWSLLQFSNLSTVNWGSWLMLEGRLTKLFPLKFNFFKDNMRLRTLSCGPSTILQSLKFRSCKERKVDKGGNKKSREFELFQSRSGKAKVWFFTAMKR